MVAFLFKRTGEKKKRGGKKRKRGRSCAGGASPDPKKKRGEDAWQCFIVSKKGERGGPCIAQSLQPVIRGREKKKRGGGGKRKTTYVPLHLGKKGEGEGDEFKVELRCLPAKGKKGKVSPERCIVPSVQKKGGNAPLTVFALLGVGKKKGKKKKKRKKPRS